ncbi:MAG: LytR/AlgR family response regulator transcription factor [Nonlabens sp.]|uniref:LytR/AlgR family response regulator transcription factor n=1 Tax=Nonlabens sp. TaxID=1888209 RepID=UPI003EF2CA6B
MSLKIYIVEDEPLIVTTIKIALKKNNFEVIGCSGGYVKAIKEIKESQPDLVLLDIQLTGIKDGVHVAQELDVLNINYLFLTSQSDPSTIARVSLTSPLGYIVKPFTEAGLISNIELAKNKINSNQKEFIKIKQDGRTIAINQAHIQYLKAFDNYCYIHTATEKFLVSHTLKHIAEQLNPSRFVQSHRSYWINIDKYRSSSFKHINIDGHDIPLSNTYKDIIMSMINE